MTQPDYIDRHFTQIIWFGFWIDKSWLCIKINTDIFSDCMLIAFKYKFTKEKK